MSSKSVKTCAHLFNTQIFNLYHLFCFVPSDLHSDSGIDEFTSPLSPGDVVTGQDDFCDTDSGSVLSENCNSVETSSFLCSSVLVEPDSCDDSEINSDDIEITITLLKALNLVDQMNGSISDFEDVLQFAKELYCRKDNNLDEKWPRNWQETQSVLKNCGYKAPRELYICLDESHYSQWDVMENAEGKCRHCGKEGSIKFYYLGISDKIQLWCANHTMCKKMMGHWDEKEHWIKGQGPNFILKEIWDGARFNEISWFWDPDSQWMLPIKCQLCGNILSIDEIKAFPKEEERCVITCPECGTRWKQGPSYARGDPRNIALIGHWDGWQPFGYPGTHSCGMSVPLRLLYTRILTKYFFYFGNYHPQHHHQQLKCSTFLVCHCMVDFQSAFFFFEFSNNY